MVKKKTNKLDLHNEFVGCFIASSDCSSLIPSCCPKFIHRSRFESIKGERRIVVRLLQCTESLLQVPHTCYSVKRARAIVVADKELIHPPPIVSCRFLVVVVSLFGGLVRINQ